MAINPHVRCFRMDSLKMPLQDPTLTHQLFQLITEMSEDEKRILLKLLKRGAVKLHPQSGWPQVAPPEGGSSLGKSH